MKGKGRVILYCLMFFSFFSCVSVSSVDYSKFGLSREQIIETYGDDIIFHIESGGTLFEGTEPEYMADKAASLGKHYFYILNGDGKNTFGGLYSTTSGAVTTTLPLRVYKGDFVFAISNVCMPEAKSVSVYGKEPSKPIPEWIDDSALKLGIEQFKNEYDIIYINSTFNRSDGTYAFEAVANEYDFLGCVGFSKCNVILEVKNNVVVKLTLNKDDDVDNSKCMLGGCILKKEIQYQSSKKLIEEMLGF
ncbi:MAG: hypothetical protein K6C98_06500 [Treponema sp.]|nr:hypothetical protein [Treponema sp.]